METKTKLTIEEFFKLYPEESRVELIDGEVYQMPAPSFKHQLIVVRILSALLEHPETKDKTVPSPVDVVLSEENVFQPDIVYISDLSKVKEKVYGPPDLVVEVVSPSSLDRDITTKMQKYQQYGVKEYWLVFPQEKTILVYTSTSEGYRLFSSATEKGKVKSKVLEGFELEVEEIFGGL